MLTYENENEITRLTIYKEVSININKLDESPYPQQVKEIINNLKKKKNDIT